MDHTVLYTCNYSALEVFLRRCAI